MASKIVIAELDIDVDGLLKTTTQLKKELRDLKVRQKELELSGQGLSDAYIDNEATIKTLSKAYNNNINALANNKRAMADVENQSELLAIALEGEVRSISEAREQNKLLNRLRNETNLTTQEGIEQLTLLNNKLDANNEFIKDNADAYLKTKINVGNYKDSVKEALNEVNLLNGGLGGFIQRSQDAGGVGNLLKTSLSGVTSGMMGMVKASLAFIATPIGAILAAIVLAFALVKNAMNRSEEATNKITKVFTIFSGIVNKLLKFLEPLGEFLIDGIVMGFELAGKAAEKALDIISGGLELLGFDKASQSVKGFKNEMVQASKDASKLADAEAQLEKAQRKSQLTQLEYQKNAEKLRQIRDNENLTIAQRIKANEELGVVLKNQLKDELKIAEQALIVANLRIKAEGQTKENLDAQAEALTTIADIQERITGQESEQLTNRVALQKEANEKAKELRDKRIEAEINASKQSIDLFIAEQGFRKKSTEETYNFNKSLLEKELKDLDLRYKRGKISKLEYEAEKLNLSNNFAKQNADLLIEEGQRELEIIKNNLNLGLDAKLEAERNYQSLRLEQGIINELEYQDAIKSIEDEYAQKKIDKRLEDQALERDRKAIDLDNKRANDQLTFEQDIALQQQQNDLKLQQELLQAEKTGADTQLIYDKYARLKNKLDQSIEDNKIMLASQTVGALASIFGEQTALGRTFATVQATIDTYTAINKTLASSPPPFNYVQAGAVGVAGFKNVAKINGIKFEKGGIQEIGGKSHRAGGTKFVGEDGTSFEAEKGEGIGILNKRAFSTFMDFNNRFGSGSSSSGFFQGGGIITQGVKNDSVNFDSIIEALNNMPSPQVAVAEIMRVGNQYKEVTVKADL